MDPERAMMIVGGQWGDEGKGKVVDLLSAGYPVVVRYNGGNNAGHTVRFADRRFALHLVPSGIIHDDVVCYLAAGMVIDPAFLVSEIDRLAGEGSGHGGQGLPVAAGDPDPAHHTGRWTGPGRARAAAARSAPPAAASAPPTRTRPSAAACAPTCCATPSASPPRPAP